MMVDLTAIRQAARRTKDENGNEVIQIPLDVWEEFVTETHPKLSQKEQIESLLEKWENEPEDDMPDEWWDDYFQFLKENPVSFGDRDLGFGEE
jgi:hypothetical protein